MQRPDLRSPLPRPPAANAAATSNPFAAAWPSPAPPLQTLSSGMFWSSAQTAAFEAAQRAGKSPSHAVDLAGLVAAKEQVEALTERLPLLSLHRPEIARQIQALVPAFNLALLAKDVYYDNNMPGLLPAGYARLSPHELVGFRLSPGDLANERSGYCAAVYRTPGDRYVVANRGTTKERGKKDWINNFRQGAGLASDQYDDAMRIAMKITVAAPGRVDFVGHSKGGGLAQAQALATGCKAVTFNAVGVHDNTLKRHDAQHHHENDLVTAYNVSGEVLNRVQDKTPRILPSVRGGRHELPAVKPPVRTPGGLQWKGEMGKFNALKKTVSLHKMNSVIASLGWQLDNLRRDAGL